jgi:hypothetical protein
MRLTEAKVFAVDTRRFDVVVLAILNGRGVGLWHAGGCIRGHRPGVTLPRVFGAT